jgi:hypothetical protein
VCRSTSMACARAPRSISRSSSRPPANPLLELNLELELELNLELELEQERQLVLLQPEPAKALLNSQSSA